MKPKLISPFLALLLSVTLLVNRAHAQGAPLPTQPHWDAPVNTSHEDTNPNFIGIELFPSDYPDSNHAIILTKKDSQENGVVSINILQGKQIDVRLYEIWINQYGMSTTTGTWFVQQDNDHLKYITKHWIGCTTVDSTGRKMVPADFFFKGSSLGQTTLTFTYSNLTETKKTLTFVINVVADHETALTSPDNSNNNLND